VTRQVVFRPEAEDEVLATRAWYEARRSGLGKEFAQAVDELVNRIVDAPMAYQRAHGDTRRAVLSRFPYAVYYRLAGEDIVVLAVHGRQHESRWQSRS
jgi:plasmid stabilization system protein ParE